MTKIPLATDTRIRTYASLCMRTDTYYACAQLLVCSIFVCVCACFFSVAPTESIQCAFAAEEDRNLVDPTQRADNSFIYDTTIDSLFNQASLYEGSTVQIVGEVIGDRISSDREGTCWITLTSTNEEDKPSISCLLTTDQANQIDRYGRYGVTGTTLQVRGTYHQTCAEHDGLPDIHATNSAVLQRGSDHPDTFNFEQFLPGIFALITGIILMGAFHFARERLR